MRTRNQSQRQKQSTGNKEISKPSESQSCLESGNLTSVSHKAVGKLLKRANCRRSPGLKKLDDCLSQCNSAGKVQSKLDGTDGLGFGTSVARNTSEAEDCSTDAIRSTPSERGSFPHVSCNEKEEMDELDWEDGSVPISHSANDRQNDSVTGVAIEIDGTPNSAKRKPIRRASAEDKELAGLVHKVHLLCLLGRGRLIDSACNDPLIQASLLSLLPTNLLKISEVEKLTAKSLSPLVSWFHNNFHIRSSNNVDRPFLSALAFALETREGTPEEVAALIVALFRALNLTARFVSILDVASLKPDADRADFFSQDSSRAGREIFNSSTVMVAKSKQASVSHIGQSSSDNKDTCETSLNGVLITKDSKSTSNISRNNDFPTVDKSKDRIVDSSTCDACDDFPDFCSNKKAEGSKRKGDLEFEMQLEVALSATASGTPKRSMSSDAKDMDSCSSDLSPFRRIKRIKGEYSPSTSQAISTAIGSRKVGAPLYWAEVFCSGENLTGKWVHVDAVNLIIDGEQKVEAAVAACKTSLRYAVAFAGQGAKDVTRRYCMKWYKIASQRVESVWWDAVLAPLKDLESGATGGVIHLKHGASVGLERVGPSNVSDHPAQGCGPPGTSSLPEQLAMEVPKEYGKTICAESSVKNSLVATRTSLEDMELETRALTEPLPTNQQAYRNHQLYAIERWLTKYQILHPSGPILGLCSGHPVYPRTCVQDLHTKERWLREGLQVKANELPAKVLKRFSKLSKPQASEAEDYGEEGSQGTVELYGKWQTEILCLPHAVNGIVPRNERGQVDVWSEKCIPPGTVHLRLPRLVPVAKRLEIDFAPAMVGFEFRNGRSIPVFEGIVVCAEFKDAILEAYSEEEERRDAEQKKRNEMQAISRWYQLLSSIVTRQKLENCYGDGVSSQTSNEIQKNNDKVGEQVGDGSEDERQSAKAQGKNTRAKKLDFPPMEPMEDHEHVFSADDQTFDEESSTRTKRCHCGFSIQVEEF